MHGTVYMVVAEGCLACAKSKPVAARICKELGVKLEFVQLETTRCRYGTFEVTNAPTLIYMPTKHFELDNVLEGAVVHYRKSRSWLESRVRAAVERGALFC